MINLSKASFSVQSYFLFHLLRLSTFCKYFQLRERAREKNCRICLFGHFDSRDFFLLLNLKWFSQVGPFHSGKTAVLKAKREKDGKLRRALTWKRKELGWFFYKVDDLTAATTTRENFNNNKCSAGALV